MLTTPSTPKPFILTRPVEKTSKLYPYCFYNMCYGNLKYLISKLQIELVSPSLSPLLSKSFVTA